MNHIWGRAARQSLWAVVFAVLLNLLAQPVQAVGENYVWKDSGDTAITATTGNFGPDPAAFTKAADVNGNSTFTGSATYDCNGKTVTSQLTITIAGANYKKTYPTPGTVTGADPACGFAPASISKSNVDPASGQPNPPDNPTEHDCNQGSFTWLLCPVIDNVSKAVSSLATDVLGPLLEVKPISPDSTPDLYKTWTHIRDFTEVLFILVFFVIIAATLMQQDIAFFDQYTIKKVLPRLVIASVLVQFSFLICGIIVDVGNVLGVGISQLLSTITGPTPGPASFSNLLGNLVTGSVATVAGLGAIAVLASWTVAVPILLSLMLSLLTVFLTLGARYLILAVLIAVSPIAMLAWVLPNTRDFAGDWLEFLFRLVMMYPLVILIISLAGIVNQILPFSGDTANSGGAAIAVALIKPLVVIAAFLVIPVSFRLAGAALHRVHNLLTGVASSGKSLIKGSDMYQRGLDERQRRKNTYMGRVLDSSTITSLQSKGSSGRATAGFLSSAAAMAFMRAPTNKADLQRSNSALIAKTQKNLAESKEALNPQNLKLALAAANGDETARTTLQRTAPDLLRYASSAPGREAIWNRLVDTEFSDNKDLEQFRTARPKSGLAYFGTSGNLSSEWRSLRDSGQSKRNQLPTIMQRITEDKVGDNAYDVTNRAGDPIGLKLSRPRGSVDVNGVSKSFSKTTAAKLADMSPDVFDMMMPANDNTLDFYHFTRVAARDGALGMAIGTDPTQMAKVFNPNDRNPGAIEKKIAIAKAMQATHDDVWKTKPEYKTTHDAVVKQIKQDNKMVNQLAKSAGIPDADFAALDAVDRAHIVGKWMRDSNYSYEKDDRQKGIAQIKAEANEERKREYLESLAARAKDRDERKRWENEAKGNQPGQGVSQPGGTPNPGTTT